MIDRTLYSIIHISSPTVFRLNDIRESHEELIMKITTEIEIVTITTHSRAFVSRTFPRFDRVARCNDRALEQYRVCRAFRSTFGNWPRITINTVDRSVGRRGFRKDTFRIDASVWSRRYRRDKSCHSPRNIASPIENPFGSTSRCKGLARPYARGGCNDGFIDRKRGFSPAISRELRRTRVYDFDLFSAAYRAREFVTPFRI